MKMILENSSIFDYDLAEKIHKMLEPEIHNLDASLQYDYSLQFPEEVIYDRYRMENFIIPEEETPPYKRGKMITDKDKIYDVLGYQLHVTQKEVEALGVNLCASGICGMPGIALDMIEIELCEGKVREKSDKKSKEPKVSSIMPSLTGFARNLMNFYEATEKRRNDKLESAFGNQKTYEKYKTVLDTEKMYEVYQSFEKQYGEDWVYSRNYRELLREKFIKNIEIQAGVIEESADVNAIREPLILPEKLIYEIPVCRMTKTKRKVHKSAGYIKVLTNGKIVRVKYEGKIPELADLQEKLKACYFGAADKDSNNKLINMMNQLIVDAERICNDCGYSLEREGFDNILSCLDLRKALNRARRVD